MGEISNAEALSYGKPLDGTRVLALEQMQALPFATQLMARLGADVVKVEPPGIGDSGRASSPAMTDLQGHEVGATFLRNNLNKRSVVIDLKTERGRQLVLEMASRYDVLAENFRAGALRRLGLAYEDVSAVHPRCIYLSVSGFGNTANSTYGSWPAYAPIAEAMSGMYEAKRVPGNPPVVAPFGGLGDIGTALFAVIGVLAALRHREATGQGQYIDMAMFDSMVAIADIVPNFWSMGLRGGDVGPLIMHGFRASDGWFVVQVGREHQFASLARVVGRLEWLDDPRFSSRQGWIDHLEDTIRPGIEGWASNMSKLAACHALASAGVAAGPCFSDVDVVGDPHLLARDMIVEIARTDGVAQPVLVPGNPVRMSKVANGPERRVPWLGEHTDEVLSTDLGLHASDLESLRRAGVIG